MKVTTSYKHLESTEAIEEITAKKSSKLEKYFSGRINLKWNFAVEKEGHVAHCHLIGPAHIEFFAEAVTQSLYSGIDEVIAKLEKQIKRKKEILKNHKGFTQLAYAGA